MISVTVKAPTGDVDFQVKPNSVALLVIDADGSPFYTRMDVPDVEAAKLASSQALKSIRAASEEAVRSREPVPELAETNPPEDE